MPFTIIGSCAETMKDKEQQMMTELHKNGLGAPTSSLDPLLAVLVQVKTCSALLRLALEIQTHEIHSQGPCSVTASE
jgi:hypothetical protein